MMTSWLETMPKSTYDEIMGLTEKQGSMIPLNEIEKRIQAVVCRVLNLPEGEASINRSFISLVSVQSIPLAYLIYHYRN